MENLGHTDISISVVLKKMDDINDTIQNTILSVQTNRNHDIFSQCEFNSCVSMLLNLYKKMEGIKSSFLLTRNTNETIDQLQEIIEKLSTILSLYGTKQMSDLVYITVGSEFKDKKNKNEILQAKQDLIFKFVHPIGYKIIPWKNKQTKKTKTNEICANKLSEEIVQFEFCETCECFDTQEEMNFTLKVHGIKVIIQSEVSKKTMIVKGWIENMIVDCITNSYISFRKNELIQENSNALYVNLVKSLTLKDVLIYGKEDIFKRQITILNDVQTVKAANINSTIQSFVKLDVFSQRNMLISLLTYPGDEEIQYIAYLLYDLLSCRANDTSIDSMDQKMIYDSFPWEIKMLFKETMKNTIQYTQNMISKYENKRISLEQQVYLLKVPEPVKEKVMTKLKEIRGKSDETGAKAKQYIEGFLKIPFGIYREEPILKKRQEINILFSNVKTKTQHISHLIGSFVDETTNKNTNQEISRTMNSHKKEIENYVISSVRETIKTTKPKKMEKIVRHIKQQIIDVETLSLEKKMDIYDMIVSKTEPGYFKQIFQECETIHKEIDATEKTMKNIIDILDQSIYAHNDAKNEILKIIAQWMNGKSSGYCFGFEGSPGVGKTSLAKKGLSKCLLDTDGTSRPFSFIALGGSSTGPSLEGYSYTYVNSSWGRIVDILMDAKCMNPIIYIDELDKVSKTENGKEIIGILTHLIDRTQNDVFQDKYFSGIPIDLSKALFIFSYNDPEQIDKVLLDRIHRIRFDNLTIQDKLVIVKQYILPEMNETMGFSKDTVILDDEIIEYMIYTYTSEPGVRKLKEMLFDLYGEINIELLRNAWVGELPIKITVELLEKKYLKKMKKNNDIKINDRDKIGVVNGLWANSLGNGGILQIETAFFPSSVFLDLKLTGMQGDVMKESMNVAKTISWNMTPLEKKKEWLAAFEETKCQGIHIHCPEGAVSKDGPSAGAAITVSLYSLFNQIPIKQNVGMTGEINLQGKITAIGSLSSKIIGGIRAGVTIFLYPTENKNDLEEFLEKNSPPPEVTFISVGSISEVFEHVLTHQSIFKGNSFRVETS